MLENIIKNWNVLILNAKNIEIQVYQIFNSQANIKMANNVNDK